MKPQRNEQGRFLTGNCFGKGRPSQATEAGYLAVLMEACGLETWKSVVDRTIKDVQSGDDRARAWLSGYLLGSPGAKAPSTTVIVQQLLGDDPPLELAAKRLAKPKLDRLRFPILLEDDERDRAIVHEAALAILAAEATTDPT
ncbi:MAG: hypothetical protein WAT36_13100 [Chromatiaceae bacterium]